MDKIVKFCKKNYKVLIPVMVVIVLVITVYFLYKEYKYDSYRNKKEYEVYQCFGGIKTDYTAIITYNLEDEIIELNAKNKTIQYDSTPVYFKDSNKVLFPQEMALVYPLRDAMQLRVYKYAVYDKDDNGEYLTINNQKVDVSYFFLHDGKGLYYFPSEVVLKINNEDYMTLGDGSYVSLVGTDNLIYYDKVNDKTDMLEIDGNNVTISTDNYQINLSEKYLKIFSDKILLSSPHLLKSVTEN